MDERLKRAIYLLMAANNLIAKQKDAYYVLNLLEETVNYDDNECDGSCLLEDIQYCLEDLGITPNDKNYHFDYSIFNIPESHSKIKVNLK